MTFFTSTFQYFYSHIQHQLLSVHFCWIEVVVTMYTGMTWVREIFGEVGLTYVVAYC